MRNRSYTPGGFSMVEVAVALGIVSFALLTVLALLPIGVKSNQISAEETRAVNLLSMIESDLRNSPPDAPSGKSSLLGLTLPYTLDAAGNKIFNPAITAPTASIGAGSSTGLDDAEKVAPVASRPRFQASLLYTNVPTPATAQSLNARLIVTWPGQPSGTLADLTDNSKCLGFVETLISFPAP